MKTLIAASVFALMSGVASAGAFDHELPFGNPDLDPSLGAPDVATRVSNSDVRVSLEDFYRGNPDVDTDLGFRHTGEHVPSASDAELSYERWIEGSDADHRV